MSKKLTAAISSLIIIICSVMPALAAEIEKIEYVTISLSYNDFIAGSNDNESNVTITLPDANKQYDVSSSKIPVPSGGWRAGDRPDLRITLTVEDEEKYRFSYNASGRDGISVDNGEVHFGELQSGGRKVYYEIYLNEVQNDSSHDWDQGSSPDSSSGGPGVGAQGAWLKDPNTNRYWYSLANGTRPVNSWLKIGSAWYFFDAAGFLEVNKWILTGGKWYYVGNDGKMYRNQRTPDKYWVNSDGSWDGKPAGK